MLVIGFRSYKNDERQYHGYEGDEVAQTEADVLLYVSNTKERHKGTSVYEPVKPSTKESETSQIYEFPTIRQIPN